MYIEDSNGKTKPVVSVVTADDPTPVVIPSVQFSNSGTGIPEKKELFGASLIQ